MVLEKALYMKGYLLKVSHEMFLAMECEEAGGNVLPQTIRGVLGYHRLGCLTCLMLYTYDA